MDINKFIFETAWQSIFFMQIFFFIACGSVSTPASGTNPGANLMVTVDFNNSTGAVQDLFGVNKPPYMTDTVGSGNYYNVGQLYQAFGITMVRLHVDLCDIYKDADIVDISSSTPVTVTSCSVTGTGPSHIKWTVKNPANIDTISNYDFSFLYQDLSAVSGSGAKVYLRLGHGYNSANDTGDPGSWARVAANVYRHLTGTFGTFASSVAMPAISHVEVFNEPDGMFWAGSKTDFFQLFSDTVDRVRIAAAAASTTVVIGGPGFTTNYLEKSLVSTSSASGFVSGVTPGRLDFFSVHRYDQCGSASLASDETFFTNVRAKINAQGLTGKPMHISEWNIGLGSSCGDSFFGNQQVQSFSSGMLTVMQNPSFGIGAAHFFSGVTPMSLFAVDAGLPGTVSIRPSAWSFWAHSRLSGGTLFNVQVCKEDICLDGTSSANDVVALAGQVSGKSYAIITNDSDVNQTITLRVNGAPTLMNANVYSPPISAGTVAAGVNGTNSYTIDASVIQPLMDTVSITTVTAADGGNYNEFTVWVDARTFVLVEFDTL